MQKTFTENKTFERVDFTIEKLPMGEYEHCEFRSCNFSGGSLSGITFAECKFTGSNLSMALLEKTALRNITFSDCKMLGLHFQKCNPFLFAATFENCKLDLCSFYKLNLKKAQFRNCSLQEADFTEADLTAAVFDTCDLDRATFDNTNLGQADLRTAYNYSIDPEMNKMKRARFSSTGLAGLLHKYGLEIE